MKATKDKKFVLIQNIYESRQHSIKKGTLFSCIKYTPILSLFAPEGGCKDHISYELSKMEDEDWFLEVPDTCDVNELTKWYQRLGFGFRVDHKSKAVFGIVPDLIIHFEYHPEINKEGTIEISWVPKIEDYERLKAMYKDINHLLYNSFMTHTP